MNLREPRTQRIILVSILGLGVIYAFFFTTYVPFTYKARAAETSVAHLWRENPTQDAASAMTVRSIALESVPSNNAAKGSLSG